MPSATRPPSGPVVVDIQALQSPTTRGRGIGRYVLSWALALERSRPDLIGRYLLNPQLPPPGAMEELLASGKVAYRNSAGSIEPQARIWHVLSPFDLALATDSILAPRVGARSLALSTTVYDLIPALDPSYELPDLIDERRYGTRLEFVRAAQGVQVLSSATADALRSMLDLGGDDLTVVGAAADAKFSPPASRALALQGAKAALAGFGLRRPFVLYPSGSHPRKNNERLIASWADLPESAREQFQLVITGEFDAPTVNHYRHLANSRAIQESVVVPGFVDEDTLVLLYQAAELVCFPSLAEGFGLPVAEALAIGTPVIGSSIPVLSELLDPWACFDPTTQASIASAITMSLLDNHQRDRLGTGQSRRASWEEVAERSGTAFDKLLSRPKGALPHRAQRTKPERLAFVSPLPPAPTGVARYSYRLIEALHDQGEFQIDVYVDGLNSDPAVPRGLVARDVACLRSVERLIGRYDQVVYSLGNSHHHLGALTSLRERSGIVLSHDVRLSNLYRHENGDPGFLPGRFAEAIRRIYGRELPAELGQGGELSGQDLERFGVLMAREVIASSQAFLVSSLAAACLARVEAGAPDEQRVAVLPFAIEAPGEYGASFEEFSATSPLVGKMSRLWGKGPDALEGATLLAHFGIVDPVKQPFLVLEAFAEVHKSVPEALLAFVGPISDELVKSLGELAVQLGLSEAILFTGPIAPDKYRAWLKCCTLAVQLRAAFNGEASAAVGECLASGVPTVVSAIGWLRELPDQAVVKLETTSDKSRVATVLIALLNDKARREQLSAAGRACAEQRSFAETARALVAQLHALGVVSS